MNLVWWERYALVVLGGGIGSAIRYWAAMQFGARALTTFWVNVVGSFLIGLLAASSAGSDARVRLLFGAGFLGGYTTFSTWQLEALLQIRHGDAWLSVANLLGGAAAGLVAVALGYGVGLRLR